MAKKRFMMTMDEDTHMALKIMATKLKINSGDVIKLMVDGLDAKIEKYGGSVMQILYADINGWTDEQLTEIIWAHKNK